MTASITRSAARLQMIAPQFLVGDLDRALAYWVSSSSASARR
jgi:hypothetical protein